MAAGVTAVAVLGATGALPSGDTSQDAARPFPKVDTLELSGSFAPVGGTGGTTAAEVAVAVAGSSTDRIRERGGLTSPPQGSGTGRRVVFAIGAQRVWLVGADGRVVRTYLVSGSRTDNLEPGRFEVYSTSRHAVGVDDSGTMQFMVRFAHGPKAAIGFHDIPVREGRLVQPVAALGTPQSHGCIRQRRADARALWSFAHVGTTVVVTA